MFQSSKVGCKGSTFFAHVQEKRGKNIFISSSWTFAQRLVVEH